MFTHQDLKNLASAASFSKGRAYFEEGLVGRVRRRGDTFSAIVNGSADYAVELTLTDKGPVIFCDCPYDYEGICKHAVALGLAVLEEQEWTEAGPARPTPANAGKTRHPAPPAAALETALRDVSKPVKLKFLEERLRQDADLARLFLLHVNGADSEDDALAFAADLPPLAELRDTLRQQLIRLRFDYDTLADKPGQTVTTNALYYNPEPVLDRVATLLNAVLLPAAGALRDALHAGRLAEGIRRWQGAWAGIQAAVKPAADVFWMFSHGRYAPLVLERWLMLLTDMGVLTLLGTMTVAPTETARCVPALTRHVLHPPVPVRPGRRPATPALQLPNVPGVDDLLLLSVSGNPSLAPALTTALRPREKQLPSLLRLRLAAGCQDWDAWERLATAVAPTDSTVALDLLRFYQQRHHRPALLRAATQLINPFSEQLTPFVLAHVTPAEDRDLYVKALTFRCEAEQRFADFEELCGLWKPAERLSFVQKCVQTHRARFTPWFRAQVLAAERRASEILPLALATNWHPTNTALADPDVVADLAELPDVLALAAHAQPEATLDAVMERVEQYLDHKPRRSTELYQRVGAWLRALHAVPAIREQVALFAEGLYTTHNRLHGLRTALREAELLPEPEATPPRLPQQRRGKRKNPL